MNNKLNKKQNENYNKLKKEITIVEKAIEKFLQNAVDSVSEKDFVLLSL